MKILWAPWRMGYIKKTKTKHCFLCKIIKEKERERNFVLLQTKKAISLLNIYPYNNGHTLVAPLRHISSLKSLTPGEVKELFLHTIKIVSAIKKAFKPSGFNVGLNLGRTAGAGLISHLHIHIVPRWEGDTNFMPVIGKTKIIPQSLEETYKKIKEKIS